MTTVAPRITRSKPTTAFWHADLGSEETSWLTFLSALILTSFAVSPVSCEDPAFAAAWANHAIMLADTPALRANRAIALQDLGLHDRAMADLDIAVSALAAQDPDLLYKRGVSRHALGDSSGALADWRAHLAAYGPGADSPFAAQIHSQAGNALNAVRHEKYQLSPALGNPDA